MCGIAGIINLESQTILETDIKTMMSKIKHRGPNDEGFFIEDNIGLGFVRLSIIDLSSDGHQPMFSSDNRYVVIFNGEIYNYIELREELIKNGVQFRTKTDTEVLLNSFIYWGTECSHKFNGMWAFVIHDRQLKKTFISRDRYGVKPLYYFQNREKIVFSSEIKPLLPFIEGKPTANLQEIYTYLVYNRTDTNSSTFFNEIKKLPHGNYLTIENGVINLKQWYDLKSQVNKTKGFSSNEEYKQLLISSINIRLRSDVPIGVCLSGGLDSSSIASLIIKHFNLKNTSSFSAIYSLNQIGDETKHIKEFEGQINDMNFIKPTSESLFNDLEKYIDSIEEPVPSTGPYAQYKVMEKANSKVTVTIGGQGADECLAGYHYFFGNYFKDLLLNFKITTFFIELFHYCKIHKSLYGIKSLIYFLLPKNIQSKLSLNDKGYVHPEFVKNTKNYSIDKLFSANTLTESLINHFAFKMEHLLKWEDKNSMRFSIESRLPFLDFRIVEKTLATSNDLKIKNGVNKYILREAMKDVLPEKIRKRTDKVGFSTPEDEWFRQKNWEIFIKELLNSDSFKNRKIINTSKAKRLYELHLKNEINISKQIWKWIHLELWFRKFID